MLHQLPPSWHAWRRHATNMARLDALCQQAMVNRVVMVGGSSTIPALQQRLANYFNKSVDDIFNNAINPDTAVSAGAAIMGASLKSEAVRNHLNSSSARPPTNKVRECKQPIHCHCNCAYMHKC